MKKFTIQVLILLIVILGALYIFYNQAVILQFLPSNTVPTSQQIKINDIVVNIELADTPAKRSKGLSDRESLATNSGMLFTFPTVKKYQFWMKGMKIPLDFIFVKGGKVVDILQNIPPPSLNQLPESLPIYEPTSSIDMMVEVSSGFISANNIKIGDEVFLIK